FAADGATPRLLVGYSADIEIIIERRDAVPRIPSEALMTGNRIYVVGADGRLEERAVETGLTNWEFTQVTSGLTAGDRVVVTPGKEGLAPGVTVTEERTE
ncbi:MAG: efflux RND transporter periplasmic adaptor subunit, partial [Pseudomonadota bacterium]|nr:efflux RND transporter periplasmic adaptor subunit [Pseudomonadota bacterium]